MFVVGRDALIPPRIAALHQKSCHSEALPKNLRTEYRLAVTSTAGILHFVQDDMVLRVLRLFPTVPRYLQGCIVTKHQAAPFGAARLTHIIYVYYRLKNAFMPGY